MYEVKTSDLFPLGQTVATPGAIELMDKHGITAASLLERHIVGDWGDLCEEDRLQNAMALKHGLRLMSVYQVPDVPGRKLWVITEADRSVTTILLPSEY